jgi:general secretion pathway protein K
MLGSPERWQERKETMRLSVRSARGRSSEGGFIIVAVLWILGALATLASIYAIYVANTASGLRVDKDRIRAEALVSAALELTAYRLLLPADSNRPTQGAFSFRMGPSNIAVAYRSEAARIDLNMAPKDLLAGLFATLGARQSDAEFYADRIIAWRTAGDGAAQVSEVDAYRAAGLSYSPRQAPFAHVEELSLVLGLPAALVERAMPYVTIFSGRPDINVVDAAPGVIAALPGMTPDRLYGVLNERRAGRSPESQPSGVTTEGSRAMRVTVGIGFDTGRKVQAEVVILPLLGPTAEEPYRVLSWQDDFDGPT